MAAPLLKNGPPVEFAPPKPQLHAPPISNGVPPPEIIEIPEVIVDKIKNRSYTRLKFLGKGGFARCYEVEDRKSREVFACKIVSKSLLQKPHQREKMAQEISIHRDLFHEFIVKFYSYFEDDNNVYIVLELCTKKSLMEMQKRRRLLSEAEVRYFLRQILLAVDYLHTSRIIHRDLKLGNIFISEDMKLKIGDFGLATTLEFMGERKKTLCGTPNYIAPEVLNKKGHSFEVDIWSIGCILYTLLIGRPPFETTSLKDTYTKIRRGDYQFPPMKISAGMKSLIQKMLMVDPSQRPSAKDVLSSAYLTTSFMPRVIPVSALTLPPRFDKEKEVASSQKRPLCEHNPKSPLASNAAANAVAVMAQGKAFDVAVAKALAATHMKTLLKQMRAVVATKPLEKHCRNNDHAEDPNCAPMLWIAKWVDYSDKYGFGYQLSDDSIGVSFNDMTKMILLADGNNMHYVDKVGNEFYHTKSQYPIELSKKVKLLNYFQQYMSENLLKAGGNFCTPEMAAMTRLPSMWTWFRTSRAVVMVLSNGTLQINNFRDHTKTILCPLMGAVTTLEHNKPMRTYKFSSIESQGCCANLFHKIEYALDKLEVILVSKDNKPTAQLQLDVKKSEKITSPLVRGKGPN